MVTHSSILAQRILWTEEPGGCHLWGRTELDTTEAMQQQQHLILLKAFSCTKASIISYILKTRELMSSTIK